MWAAHRMNSILIDIWMVLTLRWTNQTISIRICINGVLLILDTAELIVWLGAIVSPEIPATTIPRPGFVVHNLWSR